MKHRFEYRALYTSQINDDGLIVLYSYKNSYYTYSTHSLVQTVQLGVMLNSNVPAQLLALPSAYYPLVCSLQNKSS